MRVGGHWHAHGIVGVVGGRCAAVCVCHLFAQSLLRSIVGVFERWATLVGGHYTFYFAVGVVLYQGYTIVAVADDASVGIVLVVPALRVGQAKAALVFHIGGYIRGAHGIVDVQQTVVELKHLTLFYLCGIFIGHLVELTALCHGAIQIGDVAIGIVTDRYGIIAAAHARYGLQTFARGGSAAHKAVEQVIAVGLGHYIAAIAYPGLTKGGAGNAAADVTAIKVYGAGKGLDLAWDCRLII